MEYEQEVYEMTVQMKESEQLVETAMLDKDRVMSNEHSDSFRIKLNKKYLCVVST